MTPAEKLAKEKPRRKLREKPYERTSHWHCGITRLRHELRISLDDVADAIGISKTTLWQIEHGTDPMLTTAMKLSVFFGRPIESMWTERRCPTKKS